jgi:hypothetical protein
LPKKIKSGSDHSPVNAVQSLEASRFDAFSPSWEYHFTPPRRISPGNKPWNCSELSSTPAANFTYFQ